MTKDNTEEDEDYDVEAMLKDRLRQQSEESPYSPPPTNGGNEVPKKKQETTPNLGNNKNSSSSRVNAASSGSGLQVAPTTKKEEEDYDVEEMLKDRLEQQRSIKNIDFEAKSAGKVSDTNSQDRVSLAPTNPAASSSDPKSTKESRYDMPVNISNSGLRVIDVTRNEEDEDYDVESMLKDRLHQQRELGVGNETEDKSGEEEDPTAAGTRVISDESFPGAFSIAGIEGRRTAVDLLVEEEQAPPPLPTSSTSAEIPKEPHLIEAQLVDQNTDEDKDKANYTIIDAVATPFGNRRNLYLLGGALALMVIIAIVVVVVVTTTNGNQDPPVLPPTVQTPQEYAASIQIGQTVIGAAPFDNFGDPVLLSDDGTIIAIGARNNGNVGANSGLVRVFQNTDGLWTQFGNALNGQEAGDRFGFSGMAMSGNGLRIAVGATQSDGVGAGYISVFDFDGSIWIQVGQDLKGISIDDWFGRSAVMSADGSILAGGAYQSDENGENSAHIRVFENKNGTWDQIGNTILGVGPGDRLGRSMDLSANGLRLAAGATQFRAAGPGYVQVFDYDGSTWNQVGQDLFGEEDQDIFGRDVGLSSDGSILACGAGWSNDNGIKSGLVRIYELVNGTTWQQLGSTLLGTAAEDRFGSEISLSSNGTRIAIGASQNDVEGAGGYMRVFDFDGSDWNQVGKDIVSSGEGDRFGNSVELSADGSTLVVGGPKNDDNGDDSGHVRVFGLD